MIKYLEQNNIKFSQKTGFTVTGKFKPFPSDSPCLNGEKKPHLEDVICGNKTSRLSMSI